MPSCVHILKSAGSECTGMLRIALGLARHMAPLGYSTSILFLGPGPLAAEVTGAGVPCAVVSWDGSRRDLRGAFATWRWLRRQHLDVAHMHHGGLAVRAVCHAAGAGAVVQHIHSCILENAGGESISRLRFRAADAVIASSRAAARQLTGCAPEVIYAGIDAPETMPQAAMASGPFRMGLLARLVPLKNIEMAIAATAGLRARGIDAELEIAGEGPLRQELQLLAGKLGVAEAVRFLGWREDVSSLLASWNVLLLTSTTESFPVSVLEAMAAARPVVAARVGGVPEQIEDGRSGVLVRPGDAPGMTAALAELATHPEQAAAMGEAGWRRARECFSFDAMALRTAKLYAQCLSR
ncbi:MAG: glycosyltransferase family 4 protein [Acidobacteriota bacterium]|nr:glycosyltransferase family 4 protein [Acidobacteriota bacterium]